MLKMRFVLAGLAFAGVALAARGDFPNDPPNDPGYPDQYGLMGGIDAARYPLAMDKENASGMSLDKTWADTAGFPTASAGRPDVVIAYVEGGINYNAQGQHELINKIYLNRGELPLPLDKNGVAGNPDDRLYGGYDLNGDGVFNVQDYAGDPRARDANGNGDLDPEDLIVAFSDGRDDDGNGYVDDISGWDFYNNQNDPNTQDVTYGHANAQMAAAAAETDNGMGGAGACPRCLLLPIRAGAEALDSDDQLGQAWLFAADSGASVIASLTADLGYSSFMRQVVEHLWRRGVLVAESTNDFDSTDHQGGMYWPHNIGGNGVVKDTEGYSVLTDAIPGFSSIPLSLEDATAKTFRVRSGQTSWGAKHLVSVAGTPSTSASTGTLGSVLGLFKSLAREASELGYVPNGQNDPMTGPEIVQLMIATASDIDPSDYPFAVNPPLLDVPIAGSWPTASGWDLQTGYGRINAFRFAQELKAGHIHPVAWFNGPDWFRLYDPTVTQNVDIYGHVEARRAANGYHWVLEYGLGGEPDDGAFITIAQGDGSAPFDGKLGALDLTKIPQAFWSAAYALSQHKELETTEQYTVTLRLRVTDTASDLSGEERRAIAVHHDPDWLPGFPRRIAGPQCADLADSLCFSPGGESQPALVDLQGLGHLQIVFGDTDGFVHAVDPATAQELPGFPVHTDPSVVTKPHAGINPYFEPIPSNVSVGDLDHDGHLWIVAASSTASKIYVWDEHGNRRAGFPIKVATGVKPLEIPRIPRPFNRPAHDGIFATPILTDWDGDKKLEIIVAGWDGHLHVLRNHQDGGGSGELPGWPVEVKLPDGFQPAGGDVVIDDHKIDSQPVIADLDGDGKPDIVVRSQMSDTRGSGIQVLSGVGHLLAYGNDGSFRWMANMDSLVFFYNSAQEFITEGSNSPVAADLDGDGRDEIASSPVFSLFVYVFDPDGSLKTRYTATPTGLSDTANPIPDVPVSFTTTGAFGNFGGALAYAQTGSGSASIITALLTTGSSTPIENKERAFDAATGQPLPGFPAKFQGLNFLSAPLFVDVDGDGAAEILDGGDSSALHAYGPGGLQAAGFPKFTTGWIISSPSAGDLLSDGKSDLVVNTREGYTMAWKTAGLASGNNEWWHFHHDEWNTGRYGADTRPPGALRNFIVDAAKRQLTFTAPGDNWYDGMPAKYLLTHTSGTKELIATQRAGGKETLAIPVGIDSGSVQAVDAVGNVGRASAFSFTGGGGGGGGSGGGEGGSGASRGGPMAPAALLGLWLAAVARRIRKCVVNA